MSEKRFKVIDDDFSKWIVDTALKEDKHEGAIYTAYDMCHKLNELYEENEQLKEKCDALQKKTEMNKNDFFISEAKRMTLLAFIKDKALQKEYFEWEKRIYDE